MGDKIKHISWKSLITFGILLGIAGIILDLAYEMIKIFLIYTKLGGLYEMKYTFIITRYLVIWIPIAIMVWFIAVQINKGDWDMAYLKIIRHKLNDINYSKMKDSSVEIKMDQIRGFEESGENRSFLSIEELRDWVCKNSKGYVCIDNNVVLAKDLEIDRFDPGDNIFFKVSTYLYLGGSLLYNKNIKAYKNILTNKKDTHDENIDECAYIREAFNNKKFDLTVDGKEEIKNGIKKAKFIGLSSALICGLFIGMIIYEQVYEKYLVEKSTIHKEIADIPVLFDKELDEDTLELIESNLNIVPEAIREEFVRKGWKLYIKSKVLSNDGFFFAVKDTSSVIAYTSTQLKLIVVSDNQNDIVGSIIHEFGHFIDSYKYTTTNSWYDIYNKEKFNYVRSYALTSKFEGFACAFEEYIISPKRLEENCPETYKYIAEAVKKYVK